jgi:hypothetical protein
MERWRTRRFADSQGWRVFSAACTLPANATLLMLVFFVRESPEQFVVKGKIDDAEFLLRKAANFNGRPLWVNRMLIVVCAAPSQLSMYCFFKTKPD